MRAPRLDVAAHVLQQRAAGFDGVRPEAGQVLAKTQNAAGTSQRHYRSQGRSAMRNQFQVDALFAAQHMLDFGQPGDHERRLVGNLVVPALRSCDTDQLVPTGLDLLAQRRRADQAEVNLDGVETIVPGTLSHAAEVEPGRPGTIERLRLLDLDRPRGVQVLTKKQPQMNRAAAFRRQLSEQFGGG